MRAKKRGATCTRQFFRDRCHDIDIRFASISIGAGLNSIPSSVCDIVHRTRIANTLRNLAISMSPGNASNFPGGPWYFRSKSATITNTTHSM